MPILKQEVDCYPETLLDLLPQAAPLDSRWWMIYTLSRQEKQLMRGLLAAEIPFYGPTVSRRYRSPQGRLRESFAPLFPNYVFTYGNDDARLAALKTGCVSQITQVPVEAGLVEDLRQIRHLIASGVPLTPERRITAGQSVRVKNGTFRGFEGKVLRRHGEVRLLVWVRFMQQGASVLLDDCQLEVID